MAVMTRADLVSAILGRRFPAATQTTNARRWLDTAYQDVWDAFDWPFRRVSRASLAIVSGNNTPVMPGDFADVLDWRSSLYDDTGTLVRHLDENDFERFYGPSLVTGTTGLAEAFTVVNRQILLAPIPAASATYKLSYRRRIARKDTTGAVVAGPMSADTDTPLWDDHHAVLIPRAQAIGLQEINDPTWQGPQAEYERQLARMQDDYRPLHAPRQWGRVSYA